MSMREISEEFGVSISSLQRHFKNHVIRHLKPRHYYPCAAQHEYIIVLQIDEEDYHIPAAEFISEWKSRLTICLTTEEIAAGQEHSQKVKKYVGEEAFEKQYASLVEDLPDFEPLI